MLPPLDYTTWPAVNDVNDRLTSAGIAVRPAQFTDRAGAARSAVIAEVTRRTQRQFQPGAAGEVRYYDGTGRPEMEVDEMVALSSVYIVGFDQTPGYQLTDAALTVEQGRPLTRLTVARGSVPAFTSGAVFLPYPWFFPAGRQNIMVTGTFGFAATIPADLWEAACGEMAVRLAREAQFVIGGRPRALQAGDGEIQYQAADLDPAFWHEAFEQKLKLYKRPIGRRLRNLRNPML